MANAELCNWVFKEYILCTDDFKKLTIEQINFLGQLVMAQISQESFIDKLDIVRKYLMTQVKAICDEELHIDTEEYQSNLNMLFKIYLTGINSYQMKFPDTSESSYKLQPLEVSDVEIEQLLKYKIV